MPMPRRRPIAEFVRRTLHRIIVWALDDHFDEQMDDLQDRIEANEEKIGFLEEETSQHQMEIDELQLE